MCLSEFEKHRQKKKSKKSETSSGGGGGSDQDDDDVMSDFDLDELNSDLSDEEGEYLRKIHAMVNLILELKDRFFTASFDDEEMRREFADDSDVMLSDADDVSGSELGSGDDDDERAADFGFEVKGDGGDDSFDEDDIAFSDDDEEDSKFDTFSI